MSAQPGNVLALRHGADSESRVRPLANGNRRRILRQTGLKLRDFDPIGKALLEHYVRLAAKIVLIDDYLDEHGIVRDDGEPQPVLRVYVALQNSARLALQRLEEHLASRGTGIDVASALAAIRQEHG
jgi:hypothetical protein